MAFSKLLPYHMTIVLSDSKSCVLINVFPVLLVAYDQALTCKF